MAEEEIDIRLAEADDYSEVLQMSDGIYGGFDYLPELYFWMVHTSDNFPFVATANGKVVGFNNCRIINGGKTALTMASRVAGNHQGRGINEKMKDTMSTVMRQKFPPLANRMWTSWGSEAQDRYFAKNPGKFRRLFTWTIKRYIANKEARTSGIYHDDRLKRDQDTMNDPCLSLSRAMLLHSDIKKMIAKYTSHVIYPEFNPWCVVELTDVNLSHVIRTCDVMASFDMRDGESHLASVSFIGIMKMAREGLNVGVCAMHYGSSASYLADHVDAIQQKMSRVIPKGADSVCLMLHIAEDTAPGVDALRVLSERYTDSPNDGRNDGLLTMQDI